MPPLVSIIIPTYNRAHLIAETLDSVIAQTYTNWECIIVDDGSIDHTDEVVGEYVQKDSRFKYYHRTEEYAKGANSCRHIGFLKSKGEYINWFDSDDIMLPKHLKLKLNLIITNDYDFVVCEVARWYQDKLAEKKVKIHNNYSINPIIGQFIGEVTLFVSGPLWKKIFLENNKLYYKTNPSETRDTVLNDWAFSLEVLYKSTNFAFVKQVLIWYRFHSNSIYTDRLQLNVQKHFDEFKIRKEYYEKTVQLLGYDICVEKYYIDRLLKIIRTLIKKKTSSYDLMCIVLKNKFVPVKSKIRLLFYYLLAITTGKGIHRLKFS